MNRILLLSGILLLAASHTSARAAVGQQSAPAVDGASNPAAQYVPFATPRTLRHPELFADDNTVLTAPLDVAALRAEDAQADFGPLRMGVVQSLPADATDVGRWVAWPDGGHIWTLAILADGAHAVRLHMTDWNKAPGSELIVYDPALPQYARGPLPLGDDLVWADYWSPILYSDLVYVEYYLPPGLDHTAPEWQLPLDQVLNIYRATPTDGDGGETPVDGGDPVVLTCHLDVMCYSVGAITRNAVGALSYVSNQYGFFCSGAMLNRVGGDLTPFFMTARHCGVNSGNAHNLLVTWFWQRSSCGGTLPSLSSLPQCAGVETFVNDANTDFTLVGLSDVNTSNAWAGWNAGYWADGSASRGIHHPGGSYKRITFGTKTGDVTSCVGGQAWYISNPNGNGEIEPGSSGSPIIDSDERVRGAASCASWDCSASDLATYARFDQAWPLLQPFLQPVDPIYVDNSWGGNEEGTLAEPFNTVIEGVFAVQRGSNVYIDAGTYNEPMTIRKAMTLNRRNGVVTIGQ